MCSVFMHGVSLCTLVHLKPKPKKQSVSVEIVEKKPQQKSNSDKKGDGPRELTEKEKEAQAKKLEQARAEARKMAEEQIKALNQLRKDFPELFGDPNKVIERALSLLGKPTTATSGYFGIGIETAKWADVIYNGGIIRGSEVTEVFAGWPAEENGIRVGDVIIECDGHWGINGNNWIRGTGKTPIHLTIWRNGRVFELNFVREWILTNGPKTNKP